MSKFKVIEEGRLSKSEMRELIGGANYPGGNCDGYNTICNMEIKQQVPCDNYRTQGNPGGGNSGGGGGSDKPGDNIYKNQ